MPRARRDADIEQEFDNFMGAEKQRAIVQLAQEEHLTEAGLNQVINSTLYTGREPSQAELQEIMVVQPGILQRAKILGRIQDSIRGLLERFYEEG